MLRFVQVNEIAEITAKCTAEYKTGEGRESQNSIQLRSYLKVYTRVYICIAVSIHTNAQIPVTGRGMSRHGVVQTLEEE